MPADMLSPDILGDAILGFCQFLNKKRSRDAIAEGRTAVPIIPRNFRLVIDGRTFNKNQLLRRFRKRYRSRWRSPVSNDTVITLR